MDLYSCKTWDDVDFAMRSLAECRLNLSLTEAEQETKINVIKKEFHFKLESLKERIKKTEKGIEDYTKANIKDFGDKRSKKFPFGKISLTSSKKFFIICAETTLKKIKEFKLNDCWTTKEEIVKSNLKNLDLNTLAKIGATIIEEDNIKIETLSKA